MGRSVDGIQGDGALGETGGAEIRSRIMASVRQKNTSVEQDTRSILEGLGLEYEMNVKGLPGTPDFADKRDKWAIFSNGCFWHAHRNCELATTPKTNRAFWQDKLTKNRARDQEMVQALIDRGYSVMTVWQCEMKKRSSVMKEVNAFIAEHRQKVRESFRTVKSGTYIEREIRKMKGVVLKNVLMNQVPRDLSLDDAGDAYDYNYLRLRRRPLWNCHDGDPIRIVDMFCGCGGISLGAVEACRALRRNWIVVGAIDVNPSSMRVFKRNIPGTTAYEQDVTRILDGNVGAPKSPEERRLLADIGAVDILLAGPPCQGYSDLNNHTRREDERNLLYERVARFAELSQPRSILIENVPAVSLGKEKALHKTEISLKKLGYRVNTGVVDSAVLGVPQRRRRHLLIGTRAPGLSVDDVLRRFSVGRPRTVEWAIGDLMDIDSSKIFDAPSKHSERNLKRMEYLIESDRYTLPNRLRPKCHKNGNHSYTSAYGRLNWNEPSQTVTSGFVSPGQGRFVHPSRPRTLTPHEAARLQFFPDFFDFSPVKKRTALAEMIGNAAPMKYSYAFCLEFISRME